ncbi:hypothetical protein [Bacillus thuringiensis]|uniref:hypothetical protein n=1 Tax=Bacillus thuringiensis TaxID=1428 RepID=UPI0011A4E8CC|nr:hypothetical protein [Bacillus thuringiensis]
MFKKIHEYEGGNIVLEDEEFGTDEVILKKDGCIDYSIGFNGVKPREDKTGEDTMSIHICDIDKMINKLQVLKEYGRKHFKNEYWQ